MFSVSKILCAINVVKVQSFPAKVYNFIFLIGTIAANIKTV